MAEGDVAVARFAVVASKDLSEVFPAGISFFRFEDVTIEINSTDRILASDMDLRKFDAVFLFPSKKDLDFAVNIAIFLANHGTKTFPDTSGLFKLLFPAFFTARKHIKKLLFSRKAETEDLLASIPLPAYAIADNKSIVLDSKEAIESFKKLFPARKVLELYEAPLEVYEVFVTPTRVFCFKDEKMVKNQMAEDVAMKAAEEIRTPFITLKISGNGNLLEASFNFPLKKLLANGYEPGKIFETGFRAIEEGWLK